MFTRISVNHMETLRCAQGDKMAVEFYVSQRLSTFGKLAPTEKNTFFLFKMRLNMILYILRVDTGFRRYGFRRDGYHGWVLPTLQHLQSYEQSKGARFFRYCGNLRMTKGRDQIEPAPF
jgi:hypothetical protein